MNLMSHDQLDHDIMRFEQFCRLIQFCALAIKILLNNKTKKCIAFDSKNIFSFMLKQKLNFKNNSSFGWTIRLTIISNESNVIFSLI